MKPWADKKILAVCVSVEIVVECFVATVSKSIFKQDVDIKNLKMHEGARAAFSVHQICP